MAIRQREEIVGKRFLCCETVTKQPKCKLSELNWKAGVIRATTERDPLNPENQVLLEFDGGSWERRDWFKLNDVFPLFLVEHTLVWIPCGKEQRDVALNFIAVIDKHDCTQGRTKVVELVRDRQRDFVDELEIKLFAAVDEKRITNRDVSAEVRRWIEYQDGQRILLNTPTVLTGFRIEVYRYEGTTQWYSAIIGKWDEENKELTLTDDTVLENHYEDPGCLQMHLLDIGVVDAILRGDDIGVAPRRRSCNVTNSKQASNATKNSRKQPKGSGTSTRSAAKRRSAPAKVKADDKIAVKVNEAENPLLTPASTSTTLTSNKKLSRESSASPLVKRNNGQTGRASTALSQAGLTAKVKGTVKVNREGKKKINYSDCDLVKSKARLPAQEEKKFCTDQNALAAIGLATSIPIAAPPSPSTDRKDCPKIQEALHNRVTALPSSEKQPSSTIDTKPSLVTTLAAHVKAETPSVTSSSASSDSSEPAAVKGESSSSQRPRRAKKSSGRTTPSILEGSTAAPTATSMHPKKKHLLASSSSSSGSSSSTAKPTRQEITAASGINVNHPLTDQITRMKTEPRPWPHSKDEAAAELASSAAFSAGKPSTSQPSAMTSPARSSSNGAASDMSPPASRPQHSSPLGMMSSEHDSGGGGGDRSRASSRASNSTAEELYHRRPTSSGSAASRADELRRPEVVESQSPLVFDKNAPPVSVYRDPELMERSPVVSAVPPSTALRATLPPSTQPATAALTQALTAGQRTGAAAQRAMLAQFGGMSAAALDTLQRTQLLQQMQMQYGAAAHLLPQQHPAMLPFSGISQLTPQTAQLELLWTQKYPTLPVPPPWMLVQYQEELMRDVNSQAIAAADRERRERENLERQRVAERERLQQQQQEERKERDHEATARAQHEREEAERKVKEANVRREAQERADCLRDSAAVAGQQQPVARSPAHVHQQPAVAHQLHKKEHMSHLMMPFTSEHAQKVPKAAKPKLPLPPSQAAQAVEEHFAETFRRFPDVSSQPMAQKQKEQSAWPLPTQRPTSVTAQTQPTPKSEHSVDFNLYGYPGTAGGHLASSNSDKQYKTDKVVTSSTTPSSSTVIVENRPSVQGQGSIVQGTPHAPEMRPPPGLRLLTAPSAAGTPLRVASPQQLNKAVRQPLDLAQKHQGQNLDVKTELRNDEARILQEYMIHNKAPSTGPVTIGTSTNHLVSGRIHSGAQVSTTDPHSQTPVNLKSFVENTVNKAYQNEASGNTNSPLPTSNSSSNTLAATSSSHLSSSRPVTSTTSMVETINRVANGNIDTDSDTLSVPSPPPLVITAGQVASPAHRGKKAFLERYSGADGGDAGGKQQEESSSSSEPEQQSSDTVSKGKRRKEAATNVPPKKVKTDDDAEMKPIKKRKKMPGTVRPGDSTDAVKEEVNQEAISSLRRNFGSPGDDLKRKRPKPAKPVQGKNDNGPEDENKPIDNNSVQEKQCYEFSKSNLYCMECFESQKKSNQSVPANHYCRFVSFRKLKYQNKQWIAGGFCKPEDAADEEFELWRPAKPEMDLKPDGRELDRINVSLYLLKHVSYRFCDLAEQEKEARSWTALTKETTWKKPVVGVREMCDVCNTTLFNIHWVCSKCGWVVCIDCYRLRMKKQGGCTDKKCKTCCFSKWPNCKHKGSKHDTNTLMLTQMIPKNAIFEVDELMHSIRDKWSLPNLCNCSRCKLPLNNRPPNGLKVEEKLTNHALNGDRVDTPLVNGGCHGVESSALKLLADVAMEHETVNNMEEMEKFKKRIEESGASKGSRGGCSTLRDLLTTGSKSGKVQPKPQAPREAPKKLDFYITENMKRNQVLPEKMLADFKNGVPELLHFKRRIRNKEPPRAPKPDPEMVRNSFKTQYADVPHTFLDNNRLLQLHQADLSDNLALFQHQWEHAMPVLISNCLRNYNSAQWKPESFEEDSTHDLIDCKTGNVVAGKTLRQFWRGFERVALRETNEDTGEPLILKLKDWPPGEDFEEVMPDRFKDIMECLPMRDYTRRNGVYNLASHLPEFFVKPDLGPKMYVAYGSANNNKGTTNLHLDVSDAVNIIMHVGTAVDEDFDHHAAVLATIKEATSCPLTLKRCEQPNAIPGALWHIFDPYDADAMRDELNKIQKERTGKEIEQHHDPIHDQSWYLDKQIMERLAKRHVVPYTIVQFQGDAIFIPAGAPHQVRNLHSCIKAAEDFVSPENLNHCFTLTEEFRHLSMSHMNHEDKLQVKNMIYHAVKDAVTVLRESNP